jgi:hypothetical protein
MIEHEYTKAEETVSKADYMKTAGIIGRLADANPGATEEEKEIIDLFFENYVRLEKMELKERKIDAALQAKDIDISVKEFIANGKRYFIEDHISLDRLIKMELIEVELGYGRSLSEIMATQVAAMNDINKQQQGEAYIKLYNNVRSMEQMQQRMPYVLRFCALIINEENEDRKVITEDMINNKISDWRKEGLKPEPFFTITAKSSPGFLELYKKLTQNISQ